MTFHHSLRHETWARRRGRLLDAVLLTVTLGLASTAQGEPRFGVAVSSPKGVCLAIPSPTIANGTRVTLVTPEPPQTARRATVEAGSEDCEPARRALVAGPYYRLALEDGGLEHPLAVAVIGEARATVADDSVKLGLDPDFDEVMVRSCTSYEGIHFTAWSGMPLVASRLWHLYWYLGYDVEPSCREEEFSE